MTTLFSSIPIKPRPSSGYLESMTSTRKEVLSNEEEYTITDADL
jgi:hypothetical protein